jgi:hypothetical protein
MHMRNLRDETGKRKLVFLTQSDKDFLIYMSTDAWITPEVKRFKNELLDRVREESLKTNSDS